VLRHTYKKILCDAGLPEDLPMKITRHSCATALMSGNVNPKVVSERLGHSNVKITLDVYSAVAPGLQQEASERLELLVFG
jgi:integrase